MRFVKNQAKIKGSCQSERKVVTQDSKSDLPLHTIWRGKKMGYDQSVTLLLLIEHFM